MKILNWTILLFCVPALLASCLKNHNDPEIFEDYAKSFSSRRDVTLTVNSELAGKLYSVFYEFPYEDGDLVADAAFIGKTPISLTISVPKDVTKLYLADGYGLYEVNIVGDKAELNPSRAVSRASTAITAGVLQDINSVYFPEAKFNFKKDNLLKCTDLVVSNAATSEPFDEAEVWLTFIGDGGFHVSNQYGRIWMYTYPSGKMSTLTTADCTFYGIVNGNVTKVTYQDLTSKRNFIFYSANELNGDISSFRKVSLGKFPKGVNIGFAYYGTGILRFSTPNLNPVTTATINYGGTDGKYTLTNQKVSNGFIQHIISGDFEGNVLGMENRGPEESAYDGDYNDMLCLIETNPIGLKPNDEVERPEVRPSRIKEGYYIFEDNYPAKGDYDFNDAVVKYKITDYYTTSNKQKDVEVTLVAHGADFNDSFGFYNETTKQYSMLIDNIKGYANVDNDVPPVAPRPSVVSTFYGDIKPYLYNGTTYVFETTINNSLYPYVLEIPLNVGFKWCAETQNIEKAYPKYAQWRRGELSSGVWYVDYDPAYVYHGN